MEIHKPKPVHNWQEFFSEISVVVVGIVIALAGEQAVEGVQRSLELSALRADLIEESHQILSDARKCEAQTDYNFGWLARRITQVQASVWHGKPLAAREPYVEPPCETPDTPIWRSAKAAGATKLLTKGEINAFAEIEYVESHLEMQYNLKQRAQWALAQFNMKVPKTADDSYDYSVMSKDDLKSYLNLLTEAAIETQAYKIQLHIITGAEQAILDGRRELADIFASERKAVAAEPHPRAM